MLIIEYIVERRLACSMTIDILFLKYVLVGLIFVRPRDNQIQVGKVSATKLKLENTVVQDLL
jgi:hypothetical protein